MTLIVPNAAEERFLDAILATNYTLRLFANDVTAGLNAAQIEALTVSSFTEATFTGYSAKTLTGGSWTTTAGAPCVGVYAQQQFTSTADQAAQTVYGYYVTRTSGGALDWFEYFTAPVVVEFLNDAIRVTPRITLADTGD